MIQNDINVNGNVYANINSGISLRDKLTADNANRADDKNAASSEQIKTEQENIRKTAETTVNPQEEEKSADVAVSEKSSQGDELKVSTVGQLSSTVGAPVVANSTDGLVADVTGETDVKSPAEVENISVIAPEPVKNDKIVIQDNSAEDDADENNALEEIEAEGEKRKEVLKEQQAQDEKMKEALKQAQQNMNNADAANGAKEQEINLAGKSERDIERLYRQGDISAGQYQRAVQQMQQSEGARQLTEAAGLQNQFELEDVALNDAAQNGRSELIGQILGVNNTNV